MDTRPCHIVSYHLLSSFLRSSSGAAITIAVRVGVDIDIVICIAAIVAFRMNAQFGAKVAFVFMPLPRDRAFPLPI